MDIGMGASAGYASDENLNRLGAKQAQKQYPQSYAQRLVSQIEQQTAQLADLKRMQEILTKHPEFEELLTLVGRNRF